MNDTCGKIEVRDGNVSATTPLPLMKALVATGIYGIVFYALLEDGFPFRHFALSYLIVFAVTTLIWGWYVLRLRITTTFDSHAKTASRRNLLFTVESIPFSDIADVTKVRESGEGAYFKIAMKKDPLGAGRRLTGTYVDGEAEYEFFKEHALPAIEEMLDTARKESGEVAEEQLTELPENPVSYRKIGALYVRRMWWGVCAAVAVGLYIIISALRSGDSGVALIGVGAILFTLVLIHSITLDTENRKILMGRAFGYWNKSYDMARASRASNSSAPTPTASTPERSPP